MSEVSRQIINAVKNHLDENGCDSNVPMEGDLESEIDGILLDAVFPVKEATK